MKITIEIDLDEIKKELQKSAIDRIVNDYFNASEIEDWNKRKEAQSKRIKEIIDQVDWNKLPEQMQNGIIRNFIEKFLVHH